MRPQSLIQGTLLAAGCWKREVAGGEVGAADYEQLAGEHQQRVARPAELREGTKEGWTLHRVQNDCLADTETVSETFNF